MLALAPDDQLLVLEVRGQVSVFDMGPDSIRFSHLVRLEREVWDACVLGERLYVHGRRAGEGETVHVYDMMGDPKGSFGEVYRGGNPIVRHQISQGSIVCAQDPGLVLLAPTHLPEVRAYTPDGDLLWWIELEGFRPLRITELRDGRGRRGSVMGFPSGGWHASVGLVAAAHYPAALVQVAFHDTESPEDVERSPRLETFLIQVDEGRVYRLPSEFPSFVAWEEYGLFSVREDLHPQLLVFDMVFEAHSPVAH